MRRENFFHLPQDEHPSALRLRQSFTHDLGRDSADLDIHLKRSDTVSRAGDFEIHIAVMILGAGNVRENGVLLAFFHQPHGHARNRSFQRNAGIHQGKRRSTHGCHGRRSIRFQNVRDYAHRVRPLVF